jgi:CheY-like chemotaxis protein
VVEVPGSGLLLHITRPRCMISLSTKRPARLNPVPVSAAAEQALRAHPLCRSSAPETDNDEPMSWLGTCHTGTLTFFQSIVHASAAAVKCACSAIYGYCRDPCPPPTADPFAPTGSPFGALEPHLCILWWGPKAQISIVSNGPRQGHLASSPDPAPHQEAKHPQPPSTSAPCSASGRPSPPSRSYSNLATSPGPRPPRCRVHLGGFCAILGLKMGRGEVAEMQVLLADKRAEVRSALRLLLEQEPDVEILGEAVDTTGLLDWVRAACPDLLLLDWELPGLPVAALLPLLHQRYPQMQLIALSGRPENRQGALAAGAHAFVSKGDPPETLVAAVRTCARMARLEPDPSGASCETAILRNGGGRHA